MEPIEALRQGKANAIDWLVDSYSDRLLKAATLMLGDQYAAEDAVQECLIDAISSLASFRGHSSIYTWLYKILVRRCRRLQNRGFKDRLQTVPAEVLDVFLHKQGSVVTMPRIDQKQTLRIALESLNYKYREVVVLFYFEEFSINQIAALLNVPEGTIKNRLHRARGKLREFLEEGEEEACQSKRD